MAATGIQQALQGQGRAGGGVVTEKGEVASQDYWYAGTETGNARVGV